MKAGDTAAAEPTLGVKTQEMLQKRGVGIEGLFKGVGKEYGKILSIADEAIYPKGGEAGDECKVPVTRVNKDGGVDVWYVVLTRVNGKWLINGF